MIGTTITGGGWGAGAPQYRSGFGGGGLGPLPAQIQRQIDAQRRQASQPPPGTREIGDAVQPPQQGQQSQQGSALSNYLRDYAGQSNYFSGRPAQGAGLVPPAPVTQAPSQQPSPLSQGLNQGFNQNWRQWLGGYGRGSTRTQDQYRQRTGDPYLRAF